MGYPLSVRGQVCRAQGPLPCVAATVLCSWHLPSLGRVPMSSVPRRRRYYEGATTSHPASRSLLVRDRVPRGPPRFVLAEALPGGWRSRPSLGRLVCRRPVPAGVRMDGVGSHRFPGDPSRAFALLEDPGRISGPSPKRSHRCCPRAQHGEGFSGHLISRLRQGFGTRCLRFARGVAAARARLASGWLVGLCRERVELSGSRRKVSERSHVILLSRAYPVASWDQLCRLSSTSRITPSPGLNRSRVGASPSVRSR
jgi:hypothetical protein